MPKRPPLRKLSIDNAWKRVIQDSLDDLLPDPLSYADYIACRSEVIASTKSSLKGTYAPGTVSILDVPKPNFTLRPGSGIGIRDRLVYQGLVDTFAARLDASFEPESTVPSYRVRPVDEKQMFKYGVRQWFKLQSGKLRQLKTHKFMLNTDLTAYFDHIDHQVLTNQLSGLGVPESTTVLLNSLLKRWSGGRRVGIPQGTNPSSLLGNAYLDPVDKHLTRSGVAHLRYVDDLFLFGNSKAELKRALADLIRALRPLNLHVQSAKTHIYDRLEAKRMIVERQARLEAIDYEVDYGRAQIAESEVIVLLKELAKPGKFDERHFRKCLNVLRRLGSPAGIKLAIRQLDELFHVADQVARYLAPFVPTHSTVRGALWGVLSDPDRNLWSWQERWYVAALRRATGLQRHVLDHARARMQDPDCHWVTRSEYALLLGEHGDAADRSLIKKLVYTRENDLERRGFVVALHKLPAFERRALLTDVKRDFPGLLATVKLMEAAARKPAVLPATL